MKEFLKELGITDNGEYSKDNSYVIDIDDSDTYGKYYSKLDKSDLVDEIDDNSLLTLHNSSINFEGDNYLITLIADFEQDLYKLVCKEIKGEN